MDIEKQDTVLVEASQHANGSENQKSEELLRVNRNATENAISDNAAIDEMPVPTPVSPNEDRMVLDSMAQESSDGRALTTNGVVKGDQPTAEVGSQRSRIEAVVQRMESEGLAQLNPSPLEVSPLQVKEEYIEVSRMGEDQFYAGKGLGPASEYTSRAASPDQHNSAYSTSQPRQGDGKQLDVSDALSYLDAVRQQFHDRPEVYNHFLDIMKDFKSQNIDTPGVIDRVSSLFSGHPALIQGFNTFLPVGYRIECSFDAQETNLITVTTPSGTTIQSTSNPNGQISYFSTSHLAPTSVDSVANVMGSYDKALSMRTMQYTPEEIYPAVEYLTKIKQRFADHKEQYQEFLDILSMCQNGVVPDENQMAARIAKLFQNAPDLLADFQHFMPQGMLANLNVASALEDRDERAEKSSRKKGEGSSASQKRKRRQTEKEKEKEKEKERELERDRDATGKASSSKSKKQKIHHNAIQPEVPYIPYTAGPSSPQQRPYQIGTPSFTPAQPPPPAPIPDDTMFFDRVRRFLDNRDVYNEFLKVVNLFSQDIIDMRQLVEQVYGYLGDSELMLQLKEILGWDSRWEQEKYFPPSSLDGYRRDTTVFDRNSKGSIKYGPSYRRLPASEISVTCSGRDEMCRSVLNDEWASHPTWASEDAGFVAHKKNVYEEALHRSEEERHEYDFHIEAIVRTIAMLEPLNNRIAQMRPEDQASFKLKANLGGTSKSIHHRIIKKIYGRDAGLEVIEAMHDTPSVAIPVVLARLKQKEDEWKRAQREWNKVWREVDARNYQKSLDHQGVSFKGNDKKLINSKAFLSQIEAAREEHIARRASLIDPLFARVRPKWHMVFAVEDDCVLQDVVKLVFSFVDRLQHQVGISERTKIENFLRAFVPTVFMLDAKAFSAGLGPPADGASSNGDAWNTSDIANASFALSADDDISGTYPRAGRNGKRSNGGDLRKRLLKNATGQPTRKTRAGTASESASSSRMTSPAFMDDSGSAIAPGTSSNGIGAVDLMDIDKNTGDQLNQVHTSSHGASTTPERDKPTRKSVFFANAAYYNLLRLIELMHSRLLTCKSLAAKLTSSSSSELNSPFPNTLASELALLHILPAPSSRLQALKLQAQANVEADAQKRVDVQSQGSLDEQDSIANFGLNSNPAVHYYPYLLECCERLFDNEIDQQTFEDIARYMFGTKAFVMFTVDKVIGAIVKQVQLLLSDPKSHTLFALLKKERDMNSPSTSDHIAMRKEADMAIGIDECVVRVEWNPESRMMTFQLLGKDEVDAEVTSGRWQAYIDSFVSDKPTAGVNMKRVRIPYLRRNLKNTAQASITASNSTNSTGSKATASQSSVRPLQTSENSESKHIPAFADMSMNTEGIAGCSTLEIKVCVRTYRLFFVSKTEDWLWHDYGHESRYKANNSGDRDERNGKEGRSVKDSRAGLNEGEMGFVRAVRAFRRRRGAGSQLLERLREGVRVDGAKDSNIDENVGAGSKSGVIDVEGAS